MAPMALWPDLINCWGGLQVVGPADGSDYVVDYYGAGLSRLRSNNETYILPPDYSWL